MAKKKTAKKPAAKPASKASKKPAAKAAAKPAKKSGGGGGGSKVSTGSGPNPAQIGADVVALFNRAKFREIEEKWWAPTIESVEGFGVNMSWRGRAAVEAKNAGWTRGKVDIIVSQRQIHVTVI